MLNNTNTTSNNQAGIKPARVVNEFTIKTADAEQYLSKKLSAIPGYEDLVVNLFSLNLTDKFAPFVIALPTSVLKKNGGKNNQNNGEVLSVFSKALDDSHKHKIVVADEIFRALSIYSFGNIFRQSDDDRFKSIKANLGLSRTQCQMIDRTRVPHIESFGGGKIRCVMQTIDPIFLFAEMLGEKGVDNRQYQIQVTGIRKIDEASTEYTVRRVPAGGGNNKASYKEMTREIVRRMGCR